MKNVGLGKFPFFDASANQAWAHVAVLAANLVSWLQLVILPTGHRAKAWDVKNWRYRLFTIAGKLVRHGRTRRLVFPDRAPETGLIMQVLDSIKHFAEQRFTPALVPR